METMIKLKKHSLFLKLTISLLLISSIFTNCEFQEVQLNDPDTLLDIKITKKVVFNNRTFNNVKRLWIKDGGKLIIKNSTIAFIKYDPSTMDLEIHETGIIVEQGGVLIIENSTLKSVNAYEFWKGITFFGSKSF